MPSTTPSVSEINNNQVYYSDPKPKRFLWLDEFSPIFENDENFFEGSWSDTTSFKIDDREYSHGIGMQIVGTRNEKMSDPIDTVDQILRSDSKEVSTAYALQSKYNSLAFSLGVDNGLDEYFGDENSNGIARMKISCADDDRTLFDTGWVNYTYAKYDVSLDISNVDILRITYYTSGVSHHEILKEGLRFVIVNPMLELKDNVGE
jgi:hypothetical protein